ncbi:DUF4340 domain-containing protein [Haloferula sargassicola]|uniref:DUF4340 domain-containing protein n=1 Tax=Haloferula sargassicola TaxID=490096 RepID=A0ABP9UP99_9BACT
MRSYATTTLLILVTLVTVAIAGIYVRQGDLSRLFGQPATHIGQTLYDFDPRLVKHIYLASNGVGASCMHSEDKGWLVVEKWGTDRMDPRAAQKLMEFVLGARVEGGIPTDKLESSAINFADGKFALRFGDAADEPLAKFWIGHRTPWFGTEAESGDPIPTVFVAPRDRSRKDYVYACTDEVGIRDVLGDGFRHLRDHHPFLFRPNLIEHLRIKSTQGEMMLTQARPGFWSITKPLDLKADPGKVKTLLQGLYDLEAVRIYNRDEVTLPADNTQSHQQVALKLFTAEEEVVLDIYPPATEVSQTVMAVISDRPNTVFELPRVKSTDPGIKTSLTELPLTVNSLRDPTLTSIAPAGIRSIFISPATGEDIRITRPTPKDHFELLIDGGLEEPNEEALYALIKSVSEAKVAEFVSDTATDLAPYGLDQPFLILRFAGFDDSTIELRFGEGKDGGIHVMRGGTTTVVRIDPALLGVIPTHLWEWRNPHLWKISLPDVMGLARRVPGKPELQLLYDFASETWSAKQEGEDRSVGLNAGRANQLLKRLLELKVANWLPPGQADPIQLAADPGLVIELLVQEHKDDGQLLGIRRVQLIVKGNVGATNTRPEAFLLDPNLIEQLKIDLFAFD